MYPKCKRYYILFKKHKKTKIDMMSLNTLNIISILKRYSKRVLITFIFIHKKIYIKFHIRTYGFSLYCQSNIGTNNNIT